jgi:hypothetical protein
MAYSFRNAGTVNKEKPMKLEKWALTSEIIASFAVVVTLIYLAIQVRDGTRATHAANFQVAASMDQEFLLALGSDPATAHIWNGYLFAPETLAPEQELQGRYLFGCLLRRMENIYFQHRLGTISDEAWLPRQSMFSFVAHSKGYAAVMKAPTAAFTDGEFLEFMAKLSVASK